MQYPDQYPDKIKINVTASCIKKGKQLDSCLCAISLATTKRFKELGITPKKIGTGASTLGVWTPYCMQEGVRYRLSRSAQRFLLRFDDNKSKCKPASFVLTKII